jgi:hypothetical protein
MGFDVEDLANEPSGGPLKMWLTGVGMALIPIGYGVHCLVTGHARFFGRRGSNLNLDGATAISLAIAYISIGAFVHFHFFWGLHPRLRGLSPLLKLLAQLVFICSFGYTMLYAILE